MDRTHLMRADTSYAGEVTFTCSEASCGRKVVVRPGSMVVLERGDFFARHQAGTGPISFEVTTTQP